MNSDVTFPTRLDELAFLLEELRLAYEAAKAAGAKGLAQVVESAAPVGTARRDRSPVKSSSVPRGLVESTQA